MTRPSTRTLSTPSTLITRIAWPALAGAIAFACYVWTISPNIGVLHDAVDGAELIVVASRFGIAHPPGSAIWMPLGWLALHALPFVSEPALRTNLLSAALMACAVATLAVATQRWRPGTPGWTGALAGLLGGLAPLVWAQAIVTEVPLYGPYITRRFQRILASICDDCGGREAGHPDLRGHVYHSLPRLRFHDLRHSCASLLLAQGVPLSTIQEVLGHTSYAFTRDVYAHLSDELKRDAATAMDRALGGP